MSSRSLLLVLLVLSCLQSFTLTQNANKPDPCCFSFHLRKIPVKLITSYTDTERGCPKAGIIFIMKSGRRVCADPELQWVKEHMDTVDQILYANATQPQPSA